MGVRVLTDNMRLMLAAFICLSVAASTDVAKPVTRLDGMKLAPSQVSETVLQLMKRGKVPGLALAILNKSEVVYLKGFGLRNTEKSLPLGTDTIMYGASFTKSTFAAMFMQLVDEGLIFLDVPIEKQLPKPISAYPDHEDLANDPRFSRLTPRMLLSHTGGLPNVRWYKPDGTMDENAKLKTEIEPGTRFAYSGEGINLLGTLAAEVTGKSVGDLMKERIFDRFGMTRTSMTWQPQFEGETADGYTEDGKWVGHNRQKRPRAAGSMDTTIRDFAAFLSGFMKGEGLSWASREAMLSPQIRIRSTTQFPTLSEETTKAHDGIQLSYGLGWGLFRSAHGKAFFKEGHLDGWENFCLAFPQSGTAIVIMTNSSNGESIYKELIEKLLADKSMPWDWEGYVPYNH